jgi:leucyl aminopeptidase
LTRDLANMPSNVKDPAWLAAAATKATADVTGLTVIVRDEKWLADQGFGGVLAVGGGSASPPRLIELSWQPPAGRAKLPHLVLIGKGVTFDTGGISIKRPDGMHMMRTDMAGAAAVIAAVRGIAALKLPVRVTGLAPAAENHVSGSAYRPGDVVRHVDGTTTEVTNTDAEGRMLLADALGYAVRRFRPDLMVDVATLTGSMKVALGVRTGGFFATTGELAARITMAGTVTGERWWRMPLLEDHADDVRGELADVRQAPGGPGGIAAALFLREFTAGLPWAHLDIAGPARADKTYDEVVPGATGFAARTLIALAESFGERRSG